MTSRDIQRRLIVERYRRAFCLTNYTPSGWFECDVWSVSDAGYASEFEIKLTLADFKADGDKVKDTRWRHWKWNNPNWKGDVPPEIRKHDLLKQREVRGPSRFWFVVAARQVNSGTIGVVPTCQIPEWAGLIHAWPTGHSSPWTVRVEVVKEAPRLHNVKVDEKVLAHARGVCYWRMHNLFLHGKMPQTEVEAG